MLNKKQILELRPEFKFGMTMVEWFEITEGAGFFCIRSGLRHADGVTKSPYHYEDCVGGEDSEKIAIDKFNKWWESFTGNIVTYGHIDENNVQILQEGEILSDFKKIDPPNRTFGENFSKI